MDPAAAGAETFVSPAADDGSAAATRGHDAARLRSDAETLKEQAKQRVERCDWGGALFKYTQALGFVDLVEGGGAPDTRDRGGGRGGSGGCGGDVEWVRGMRVVLNANAAHACIKSGRWGDAVAACGRVLDIDAHHEKALFRLAVAQRGAGDTAAAVATLQCLLEHQPTSDAARALQRTYTPTQQQEQQRGAQPLPAVTAAVIARAFSRQYDPPPVPSTAMPPGTGNASGLLKPLPVEDDGPPHASGGGRWLWDAAVSWLCCRRCRRGHARGGGEDASNDIDTGKKFV